MSSEQNQNQNQLPAQTQAQMNSTKMSSALSQEAPRSPKQSSSSSPKPAQSLPKISEDREEQKKKTEKPQTVELLKLNSPQEVAEGQIMEEQLLLRAKSEEVHVRVNEIFGDISIGGGTIKESGSNGPTTAAVTVNDGTKTNQQETKPQLIHLASSNSQNGSNQDEEDASYHGKKSFTFSKDDGFQLTNEQRQIRRMKQMWYFSIHTAVITMLVLAVLNNSRLFGFIAIAMGGRTILNLIVVTSLALFLESSTHVVGKMLYFTLNGIQTEFVELLHGILCLCCWTYYVKDVDLINDTLELKQYWYLTTYRILASWTARCCMHIISRAIFNYMLVNLQRRVYSDQMMSVLIEEFALMKLFKAIVPQREIYNAAHNKLKDKPKEFAKKIRRVGSTSTLLHQYAGFGHTTFPVHEDYVLEQHAKISVRKKRSGPRPFEPDRDRGGAKLGAITAQPSTQKHQMTLTRAARLARYIKKYNLRIPRMFADRANQTFIKDEPLIIDDIILDESVASTCGSRLAITLRKIQQSKRLRVTAEFLKSLGCSKDITNVIMDVFDVEKTGHIDRDMMIDKVIDIYENRKNMQLTLGGSKTVLATLERMMLIALYLVLTFIILAIFKQNVLEMWLTLSSFILAFAFMFGNAIRECFEGVVFIFITHPYDVGDNILVNGNRFVVKNITILQTETVNWNGEVTYYRNQQFMSSTIVNMSRSKSRCESFDWLVDMETPDKCFDGLLSSLHNFTALNSADVEECFLKVAPDAFNGKIRITVFIDLKFNGLPVIRSLAVRNACNNHVRKYFVTNNVKLHALPMIIAGNIATTTTTVSTPSTPSSSQPP